MKKSGVLEGVFEKQQMLIRNPCGKMTFRDAEMKLKHYTVVQNQSFLTLRKIRKLMLKGCQKDSQMTQNRALGAHGSDFGVFEKSCARFGF